MIIDHGQPNMQKTEEQYAWRLFFVRRVTASFRNGCENYPAILLHLEATGSDMEVIELLMPMYGAPGTLKIWSLSRTGKGQHQH